MRSLHGALPLLALVCACQPGLETSDDSGAGVYELTDARAPAGARSSQHARWDLEADSDMDGLEDAYEDEIAEAYMPFLSRSQSDGCPESGIVYRAYPHPDDPSKVYVLYDVLYDNDCGTNGHPGDDEVFAVAIDPAKPAPEGILAMVTIAHQDTLCNKESRCQTCGPEGNTCTMTTYEGQSWPVVFASRGKHAGYLFDGIGRGKCDFACFFADHCEQASSPARPPMLNVGEPDAPATHDLTEAGLVTPANGFEEPSLYNYDPWGPEQFGEAGVVSGDLVDPDFEVPLPSCG